MSSLEYLLLRLDMADDTGSTSDSEMQSSLKDKYLTYGTLDIGQDLCGLKADPVAQDAVRTKCTVALLRAGIIRGIGAEWVISLRLESGQSLERSGRVPGVPEFSISLAGESGK
jgi:hypothetical protein